MFWLSLLEHDDDQCSFQIFSRNHFLLSIRLFLVALQNLVRSFLFEDHCGVLLFLRCLADFGRMVGLQNLFLPTLRNRFALGEYEIVSFFRHKNFSCFFDSFTYTSDASFSFNSSTSATSGPPLQLPPARVDGASLEFFVGIGWFLIFALYDMIGSSKRRSYGVF